MIESLRLQVGAMFAAGEGASAAASTGVMSTNDQPGNDDHDAVSELPVRRLIANQTVFVIGRS